MEPVVATRYGRVQGTTSEGVSRFLGIPYAASPTGPRRFRAPQPPAQWDGVRSATAFGPTPPVTGYRPPTDSLLYQPTRPGDDWLTVNVWTPDPHAAGLPVMVWIYGGAFANGNTAVPIYDGQAFARDGVVLVSVNYRLGIEGFAHFPDAPANRGLLDQTAALEWVAENIPAFGGDPGNVTVFGESAGAMSVTSLLAAPRARGMFAKAITQSGSVQAAAEPGDASLVTAEVASLLGREATAGDFSRVDPTTLLATQREFADTFAAGADPARFGTTVVASQMPFIPVIDGDLLPEHPMTAIASGSAADVPLLTGTTTEEFRFFLVPSGLADAVTDEALAPVAQAFGASPDVLDLYRANRPGASAGDVLAAVLTDAYFRRPALDVVEARRPAPSWVYEFAWRTDHRGLGAAHALDVPFVFDTLWAQNADWLTGPNPPQKLADAMHAAWVRFATTGDPGWQPYEAERTVMVFDEHGSIEDRDPRGDERAAWRAGATR